MYIMEYSEREGGEKERERERERENASNLLLFANLQKALTISATSLTRSRCGHDCVCEHVHNIM